MTFCDALAQALLQLQVAGVAEMCLVQRKHVFASVPKFCSRLGLGLDFLADTGLDSGEITSGVSC